MKTLLFVVLIVVGLSFVSMNYLASGDDNIQTRAAKLIRSLDKKKQPGEISVVLIGNSRLRYAWRLGDTPDNPLTLPDGRTMRSVKISQDNGIFMQFVPLESALLEAAPDILVIQRALFYRQPDNPGRLSKIRKLPYIMAFKSAMWGDTGDKEWEHQQYDRVCAENYSRRGFETRIRRHFLSGPPEDGGEPARKTRAFIQNMLDAGIRVVILRIPPNISAAEKLGVNPIKLENIHMDEIPPRDALVPTAMADQLEWIAFEERGDIRDFCDTVHMRKDTSAEFATWFKDEIARIAE